MDVLYFSFLDDMPILKSNNCNSQYRLSSSKSEFKGESFLLANNITHFSRTSHIYTNVILFYSQFISLFTDTEISQNIISKYEDRHQPSPKHLNERENVISHIYDIKAQLKLENWMTDLPLNFWLSSRFSLVDSPYGIYLSPKGIIQRAFLTRARVYTLLVRALKRVHVRRLAAQSRAATRTHDPRSRITVDVRRMCYSLWWSWHALRLRGIASYVPIVVAD